MLCRFLILIYLPLILVFPESYCQVAGTSMDLDATNAYVEIPDNNTLDLTNNFTVEAWVNPCANTATVVSKQQCSGEYSFYMSITNKRLVWSWQLTGSITCNSPNVFTSATIINTNAWTHVAVVHQSTGITMYINGVQDAGGSLLGTLGTVDVSITPMRIGAYQGISGNFVCFNGGIDEVHLWNVIRTQSQIAAAFNQPLTGGEAGLVAYYDMEGISAVGQNVAIINKAVSTGNINNGTTIGSSNKPSFINAASFSCMRPQTISFDSISPKFCNAMPFAIFATSSSGYPVSYSIQSGPASLNGDSVILTGTGTITIKASRAGDSAHAPAPDAFRTFLVSCDPQTISFASISSQLCNASPFTVSATSSSGYPVSLSVQSGPATISGSTVSLTGSSGVVTIKASQAGDSAHAPAPNVYQSFNVSCDSILKIYELITANGDGDNDAFYIENLSFYPDNEVTLYNQWGNRVYHSKGYQNDWSGKNLPDGNYFYLINIPSLSTTFKGGLLLTH